MPGSLQNDSKWSFWKLMVLFTFGCDLHLPAFCLNSGPTSVSWWYLWFQALALQVVLMPCIRIQGVSWPTGDVLCSLTSSLERGKTCKILDIKLNPENFSARFQNIYQFGYTCHNPVSSPGLKPENCGYPGQPKVLLYTLSALLAMAALATPMVQTSNVEKRCCEKCGSGKTDPNLQKFRVGIYIYTVYSTQMYNYSDLGGSGPFLMSCRNYIVQFCSHHFTVKNRV